MTRDTDPGMRAGRHHMDGWMPWAVIVLSIAVALLPTVPFPGHSAALAALGVTAYLLGRRHVQREVDELMAMGETITAREREIIAARAEAAAELGQIPLRDRSRTPERPEDWLKKKRAAIVERLEKTLRVALKQIEDYHRD